MRRRTVLQLLGVAGLASASASCRASGAGSTSPPGGAPALAIVGTRVIPSPTEPAIADAAVVVADGLIAAVGPRSQVRVPPQTRILDGAGLTVTAGFWNTHVHFLGGVWRSADTRPASDLAAALRTMLTRWGVVRVVDVGSLAANTQALGNRIASGEVAGPVILTAGVGFVPVGGSPFYIRPAELPELPSPVETAALVDRYLAESGVDV